MFFLAMRQLLSRKKQTFLILLGISLGTMIYVFISAVQLGMRDYIAFQLLNNTAHILISGSENYIEEANLRPRFFPKDSFVGWITPPSGKREDSKLENYWGWYERLRKDPNVYDFSPRLAINALASQGKFQSSISIIGTIPAKQIRISSIEEYMQSGSFSSLEGAGNKIILGKSLAKELGVHTGQLINLSTSPQSVTSFKITGIFSFGDERADKAMAFAHLNDVQTLNKTPGRVSEIAVALFDIGMAQEIANKWSIYTNDKVQDWQEANKMFMEMIKMQDAVRNFITIAILIVAAFGIYNVLTILISQKKKEIAILRSIGYGPFKILELILIQGLFLGFSGGILGLIFGYIISKLVESIDLGFEIGKSNHLLISYKPEIYIIGFWAAIIASAIASYLPARHASKMTPMDIIRGE